jgi:hypothetical protein
MGVGDYIYRQLRRDGLPIIEIGKKRYVLGADWLNYLARAAADSDCQVPKDWRIRQETCRSSLGIWRRRDDTWDRDATKIGGFVKSSWPGVAT